MSETLFVFLTTTSVMLSLQFWKDPTNLRASFLGICVGVSALCKPVLLIWIPLVLGIWGCQSNLTIRHRAMRCLMVCVCLMLIVFPWTLRNYALSGKWIPISTNAGINLLVGNHPGSRGFYDNSLDYMRMYQDATGTLDFVTGDKDMSRLMWRWTVEDPLRISSLAVYKLVWFWNPWVRGGSVGQNVIALCSSGPLLVFGLWGASRLRKTKPGIIFISLMVCLSGLHMIFFAHTRFRLPIDAVLCTTAAWMITQWIQTRKPHDGV